jgi:hypothetical protein
MNTLVIDQRHCSPSVTSTTTMAIVFRHACKTGLEDRVEAEGLALPPRSLIRLAQDEETQPVRRCDERQRKTGASNERRRETENRIRKPESSFRASAVNSCRNICPQQEHHQQDNEPDQLP